MIRPPTSQTLLPSRPLSHPAPDVAGGCTRAMMSTKLKPRPQFISGATIRVDVERKTQRFEGRNYVRQQELSALDLAGIRDFRISVLISSAMEDFWHNQLACWLMTHRLAELRHRKSRLDTLYRSLRLSLKRHESQTTDIRHLLYLYGVYNHQQEVVIRALKRMQRILDGMGKAGTGEGQSPVRVAEDLRRACEELRAAERVLEEPKAAPAA
ncbi:hypothetical protein G7K_0047-t1 [Saitoella complicata NRRL Y-17804]|uniref:Uncharacterized protein n=1 Tax=Saitoella complicata (strain BCRC 22490 / CBS 7301 / JCM 7358 / NBRC 10748 / NRRL Y-17804) TaxID=698492 RepID=A0A0E9N7U6_SAICN|nr:hypothetical protein G7K_0047-t1 [Saitoella complicata NRRL Y-17804]